MRIYLLDCGEDAQAHIWTRHRVSVSEVEEAAYSSGLTIRGRGAGVYEVYGTTDAGRYLMLAVRYLGRGIARLITARDMTRTERRRYLRHVSH